VGIAPAWIVAGPPGAGKSTVAALLLRRLRPVPALLDKDTLYGGFVAASLAAAGRPAGEREGPWYDEHIKHLEYDGLTAVAREIRAHGCPVLLSGPFTHQTRTVAGWQAWRLALGGGSLCLFWVRVDAPTLHRRLVSRGSPRDGEKLRRFDEYLARIQPDRAPEAPHVELDNRLSAAPLESQVDRALIDLRHMLADSPDFRGISA